MRQGKVARARRLGQLGGRASGQHRQPEQCAVALGGDGRNLCLSLVLERGDPRGVEPRGHADFDPALGELQRLVEQLDDARRDRQPLGRAGGVGIGACGFGDDRDADRIGIAFGGADIAARGLDVAADAPEQVDLIGDVEPAIEAGRALRSTRSRGRG